MPTSLKFPIQLDPGSGSLKLSTGPDRVREQILEILTTDFFSRVLRPEFGSETFLFQALTNPEVLASRVQFSLRKYLSVNIETNVSAKITSAGKVELEIRYFDSSTSQQGNVRTEFTQ